MKGWRSTLGAVVLVATLTAARPAHAEFWDDAGWGMLTVVTNVFYMPAKIVYATAGAVTGGFAYALTAGDLQTAQKVWVPSLGGTYALTPRMLQGQEPIYFAGGGTSPPTTDSAGTQGVQEQPLGS